MLLGKFQRADGPGNVGQVRLIDRTMPEILPHRLGQRITMRDQEVDRLVDPLDPFGG
jgi:hypothetical protein